FYAFFKTATVGPCNTSKPGLLDFTGRAKWNAWKDCVLTEEEAMTKYIDLARQHGYSSSAGLSDEGESPTQQATPPQAKTGTGVSVSTMSHTDEEISDAQKSIYDYAQENNASMVLRLLELEGSPIDRLDESGCSLLHYAADRGHAALVRALLERNANVSIRDPSGMTPLHYGRRWVPCSFLCETVTELFSKQAATSGHSEVIITLLQSGAKADQMDDDGQTPLACADDPEIRRLLTGSPAMPLI
ncbi:ankyrin repeat-containing domain protein, partial [Gaertneriomyces semiglobifer]